MKVEYKRFLRRVIFQKWCKENLEGFETYGRNQWCFKKGEDVYKAPSVTGFAKNVNEAFSMNLYPKNCKSVHGRTTLCFLLEEDKVVAVTELISTEEAVTEEVVAEVEDKVVEEVVSSEVEEAAEPDWAWVDSLEDSTETRKELDIYAEKFDVKLKRTMKVTNMAKKFKEALGVA